MYDEEKELICILDELGYTYSLEAGCWCSKSHEDGTLFMTIKQAFSLAHRVAYRDDVRQEEREETKNNAC